MTKIQCTACKLGCVSPGADFPMMQGSGPMNAEIVIILPHPTPEGMQAGSPLAGQMGQRVVVPSLRRAGIDPDRVYATYLIKHPLKPGQKTPVKREIAACRNFLDLELQALENKKVLVPMGSVPVKTLVGYGGVNDLRGRALAWDEDPTVTICATLSPGMFAYKIDPKLMEVFDGDLRRAAQLAAGTETPSVTDVTIIQSKDDFRELIQDMSSHDIPTVAMDLETSGLDPRTDKITDVAFCARPGKAYVVPIREWTGDQFRSVASSEVVKLAEWCTRSSDIRKIWHNGRFDYTFLVEKGIVSYEEIFEQFYLDTMCFHYLGVNQSPPHKLEYLAGIYTNMAAWDAEKLAFEAIHGKGQLYRMPVDARARYAGGDVDATWRLSEELPKHAFEGAMDVYDSIMRPLLPGIVEMQVSGFRFDTDALNEARRFYLTQCKKIEQTIYDLVGETFNIASPDQMVERMTRCLGFQWTPMKQNRFLWTEAGKRPSLKSEVRETWEELLPHPIWAPYNDYVTLKKLLGYTGMSETEFSDKSLPSKVCAKSNRIYTSISPTTTLSSRRAASDPNLQNIPIRSENGKLLRDCFVATPGKLLCVPDLDTAEAFVAAYLSEDPLMIRPFEDKDINLHTQNTSILFGIPYDDVDEKSKQRDAAKMFFFGTLYGGKPKSLARKISAHGVSVSETDVQQMYAKFMATYRGYSNWMQKEIRHVVDNGWNQTLYGFRRYYRMEGAEDWERQEIVRQLCNMPIQGSVAGHVARSYRRVQVALRTGMVDNVCYREGGFDGSLILEVHDELIAEVDEDQATEFLPVMIQAMTHPLPKINLPIPVSGDIRSRWLPDPERDAKWNQQA